MILVQLNPIGLYTSKDKRIWDDLISNTFTVKYVTNNLPAIAFVSSGTVTGTIQLYDCEDIAISSSLNLTAAVGESLEGTTCTLLSYAGSTLTSQEDGFYYYKITLSDTTVIYSDMFEWATDCSDYLKFAFTNCLNILAGGISYLIPAWDFYLQYDASGSKYETTIEVDEEEGIKNASQGSTHKIHSFELIADQNIVNLLNALQIIRGNGTITCTYDDKSHVIDNIELEVGEYYVQTQSVTLKFVDRYETYSMLNA